MSPDPSRASVPGATLARQLARLSGRAPARSAPPPADLLGDWLDWQRAVALSRALDLAPAEDVLAAADPSVDEALPEQARAVRAALEAAIADDARDWTRPLRPRAGEDGTSAAAGADAVQRHCQGLQRDMQAATGRLRGELRECLERRDAAAARLAAVDATMEGLLAPREHALLAPLVPALVTRFGQLHAREGGAASAAQADAVAAAPPDPHARRDWRDHFRAEARQLLLAELDLRFLPIEALLAALRTSRTDA